MSDFVFLLQLIIFDFVLSEINFLRDELESDNEGDDVISDVISSSDARNFFE